MNKPRVLMIEDEADIRRFVRMSLEREGMTVFEAVDAAQGRVECSTRQPDLVIVDLGLPDEDGKTLIRELRGWSRTPVVVLSARDRESEKVEALNLGADDYLTKPFGVPELIARVKAQLRRASFVGDTGSGDATVRFGDIRVNLATYEVTRAGAPVHLTPTEFRLLAALIRGYGKVLTYRQLLLDVWGPSYVDRPQYLRVYMAGIRQKLEEDPARPKFLMTELQVGYRLAGLDAAGERV
jgi:two-component system KDP operon response regulator KdpE